MKQKPKFSGFNSSAAVSFEVRFPVGEWTEEKEDLAFKLYRAHLDSHPGPCGDDIGPIIDWTETKLNLEIQLQALRDAKE